MSNKIRRTLYELVNSMIDIKFRSRYKKLLESQWKNYGELRNEQEKQMHNLIYFAYRTVPYYHKLFKDLNLEPTDIKCIEDLEKIPIINKTTIKENWDDFKPINLNKIKYNELSTGGSTGIPFKYRMYKFDGFLQGVHGYRGWNYAGYELGDRLLIFGGSSLVPDNKLNLLSKIYLSMRNMKMISSFDMGESDMRKYIDIINKFKPKFIYCYASSIYFLSKWIEKNQLKINSPLAVLSTSEKLYPNMRKKIEEVFNCDVYDGYGLNDGGVSAFECSEHNGLHIDTERSIMEVVDKERNQIENGEGTIIATSLYNYAMPFIRYDTGDLGYIIDDVCGCGRSYKLLKEVIGRSVDMLVTPEGKNIHGWFFLYIFWKHSKGIKEYQVTQEKLDTIVIKIVPEDDFDETQLKKIREIVEMRSQAWNIEFKFVDKIERKKGAKYKFIINNLK